jgi:hypothetical protein
MPKGGSAVSSYGVGKTNVPPVYGGFSGGNSSALGGNIGGKDGCIGCEPNVPYITTMIELLTILESLKETISKYYPPKHALAPFDTPMRVTGSMSFHLYARVRWSKMYTTIYRRFDPGSLVHVNLLKDIYISYERDWREDEWLRDWKPS